MELPTYWYKWRSVNGKSWSSLYVINEDTKTHVGEARLQDSNLDLIITNKTLYNYIEYRQLCDTWGSDHFPLAISVRVKPDVYSKKSNRLSTVYTDWRLYADILNKYVQCTDMFSRIWVTDTVEGQYTQFIDTLRYVVTLASKKQYREQNFDKCWDNHKMLYQQTLMESRNKTTRGFRHNPMPWWNCECQQAVNQRQAAFKKYIQTR